MFLTYGKNTFDRFPNGAHFGQVSKGIVEESSSFFIGLKSNTLSSKVGKILIA